MDNNIFKLKNKIIVVTGCNGQLGKAICSFFKKINSIVIGFDLSESESLSHLNEFFRVDIVNREELNQTFYLHFVEKSLFLECLFLREFQRNQTQSLDK